MNISSLEYRFKKGEKETYLEQNNKLPNRNCKPTAIILRRMPVVQKRSFVLSFLKEWKHKWEKAKLIRYAQQDDDDIKFKSVVE